MDPRPFRIAMKGFLCALLLFAVANLLAQAPTGALNGVVTDPSGAVIAMASDRLDNSTGQFLDSTTN